jgi:hypothetical protein
MRTGSSGVKAAHDRDKKSYQASNYARRRHIEGTGLHQ